MKISHKHSIAIISGIVFVAFFSCSDPWENRINTTNDNLSETLGERLTDNSQTSEFGKLLIETGYNRILANSKTFTVWAPTNDAMAVIDNSILSSTALKTQFVQNHIALTAFSSVSTADTVTIQMLSNKYLDFINGSVIDDANITLADQYTSNGLYHIVDKVLAPKLNIWEYINQNTNNYTMGAYLTSLNEFNLYRSDSIAKANNPVPERYSDSLTNSYLKNVYNLNNEKNKYTFFLLENDGYNTEVEKLEPYLIKSNQDSTTTYASYFTARDLAFHKAIARENLPDTLTSVFGVKVPINIDNIVNEVHLSNGIVYIMNALDIPLETRLLTTTIEGENPSGFSQGDKRSSTFYREKEDLEGSRFSDIMVQNHGVPLFSVFYNTNNLYSTTYQVYWRAINDIQENTFQQRIRFGGVFQEDGTVTNPIAFLDYTNVEPDMYDEIYIGEFTLDQAGSLDLISLIAANSGTNGVNTLTLDYLKLVPVIK